MVSSTTLFAHEVIYREKEIVRFEQQQREKRVALLENELKSGCLEFNFCNGLYCEFEVDNSKRLKAQSHFHKGLI